MQLDLAFHLFGHFWWLRYATQISLITPVCVPRWCCCTRALPVLSALDFPEQCVWNKLFCYVLVCAWSRCLECAMNSIFCVVWHHDTSQLTVIRNCGLLNGGVFLGPRDSKWLSFDRAFDKLLFILTKPLAIHHFMKCFFNGTNKQINSLSVLTPSCNPKARKTRVLGMRS